MEKRSLFQRIFGTDKSVIKGETMTMLNGYQPVFIEFNNNIYDNITARSCIDAIARNGAKLLARHVRTIDGDIEDVDSNLQFIISRRPNEIMNAYDLQYKVISHLQVYNNAYIYIKRDAKGEVIGLYPLKPNMVDIKEFNGDIFLEFGFYTGRKYTAPLNDVIHLKRFYCNNEISGGDNNPLIEELTLQGTIKQGVSNAIKTTAGIKGIVKITKSMLDEADVKRNIDKFTADFVNANNTSGIAGLDATMEFKEVNINPKTATSEQIAENREEILSYYGVSDVIIKSKYTEDEWNSFYESILEPIFTSLYLEYNNKALSPKQIRNKEEILIDIRRLQFMSSKSKIDMMKYGNNHFTIDEIRAMQGASNLPNGEGKQRMQDLNHVSSDIANEYQGGKDE